MMMMMMMMGITKKIHEMLKIMAQKSIICHFIASESE